MRAPCQGLAFTASRGSRFQKVFMNAHSVDSMDKGHCSAERLTEQPPLMVKGKFFFRGGEKFYIKGVTYGPFRPDDEGCEYHYPEAVRQDFAEMHRHGINAVRTYTVPPKWFLDLAHKAGLYVLVGVPWEQHVTFLGSRRQADSIVRRVVAAVRECDKHPAILGYTVGNEIPAPLVRWYGHRRVEKFLERLYCAVKDEDPD